MRGSHPISPVNSPELWWFMQTGDITPVCIKQSYNFTLKETQNTCICRTHMTCRVSALNLNLLNFRKLCKICLFTELYRTLGSIKRETKRNTEWLALSSHSKKVLDSSPRPTWRLRASPLSSRAFPEDFGLLLHPKDMHVRLIGGSKLEIGLDMSVNSSSISLCVSPVIAWQPNQGVPCI